MTDIEVKDVDTEFLVDTFMNMASFSRLERCRFYDHFCALIDARKEISPSLTAIEVLTILVDLSGLVGIKVKTNYAR